MPLLGLLLALSLIAPASGQVAPDASVEISGLPATAEANGTLAALPFQVTFTAENLLCIGAGPFTFTVLLAANGTDAEAPVQVTPSSLEYTFAPGQSVIQAYSDTQDATLLIGAGPVLDRHPINVTVTATYAGGNGGCQSLAGNAPAAEAAASTVASFGESPATAGGSEPSEEMPGPGVAFLAAALALAALTARRRR